MPRLISASSGLGTGLSAEVLQLSNDLLDNLRRDGASRICMSDPHEKMSHAHSRDRDDSRMGVMVFEAWHRQREVPRALLDDARPGHLWSECDCATTHCTIRACRRERGRCRSSRTVGRRRVEYSDGAWDALEHCPSVDAA
ncbi:hypothetical protein GCM10007198_19200 [Microbacterium aerolatum]|uniref:Uncharacterized protein n=1 Tax=Microbacterium aerolatum TaxID=153731 RepID=A0A511AAH5_9MICO|nr:hypothetical protein MAE01_03610 [Microbacterium aerolatum]GGB28859.1 hypothetical protein GCM10007198_19200 [Microbacterium aerolatum]